MPQGDKIIEMKVSEGLIVETFLTYKLILSYVFRLRFLCACETAFAKKHKVNHPYSMKAKVEIKMASSLKKKNNEKEQSKTKQRTLTLS